MAEQENELSEQTVKIHGIEHTMLLSSEDAERYKAQEEAWESAQTDAGAEADTKASSAENKAKTPENKSKG